MESTTSSGILMNATSQTSTILQEVILFRYFGITVAVYAIIVGGIGNLLTILAFAANKKLQTTFNVFVVNLSVIDFLTATLMLPFNLAGYVQMSWPFGNTSITTRLQAFSYFSCGYTSVVFLVVITINRFIGAWSPTRYNQMFRRNRLYFSLAFCWLFAPLCLLPFLIRSDPSCNTPNNALTGFHPKQFLCTFICLPNNGWFDYMQFTRITFQFIPLGIMVLAYGSIFIKLNRKTEKMMTARVATFLPSRSNQIASEKNGLNKDMKKSRHYEAQLRKTSTVGMKRSKENYRMLLISVAICIGFLVTFLPSVIINLIPGSKSFDPRFHMMASNLSWFNSSINPIIYVILNRRLRKEYIRLIRMFLRCNKDGAFIHESSSTTRKKDKTTPIPSQSSTLNQNQILRVES